MPIILNDQRQLIGAVFPDAYSWRCTLCGYNKKQTQHKTEEAAKKAFDRHIASAHSGAPTVKRRGYFETPSPLEPLAPRKLPARKRPGVLAS